MSTRINEVISYLFFRPKSNHTKNSALNAGLLVGSQKGDVFDYMTNLLENFEKDGSAHSRERILSTGSENDDAYHPVSDSNYGNRLLRLKVHRIVISCHLEGKFISQ